jgi:hypothetical protein
MAKHVVVPTLALVAASVCSLAVYTQGPLPGLSTIPIRKGEKPGPAPRHDLAGIWEPATRVAESRVRARWRWTRAGVTRRQADTRSSRIHH